MKQLLSIILFIISMTATDAIELSKDGKSIVSKPKAYDNQINVKLLYQAEELSFSSSSLSSPANIVSDIIAGAEIEYAGPWRNSLQDFIKYKFKRRSYVQPNQLNLEDADTVTHHLSMGGRWQVTKDLRLGAALNIEQKPTVSIDSSFRALVDYPLLFGGLAQIQFNLYQKDKNNVWIKANGIYWNSKSGDNFELDNGSEWRTILSFQRTLQEDSRIGFELEHGSRNQNNGNLSFEQVNSSINIFFIKSFY